MAEIDSISARDLAIEWINDRQYWKWSTVSDFEVAELLQVWFLNARGYFGTDELQHGVKYKIVFVVMLLNAASGWEAPVKLKLTFPDGSTQQRQERFNGKPRNQWLEIAAGEFTMSPAMDGTIEASLEQTTDSIAKKGLLIKAAVINTI